MSYLKQKRYNKIYIFILLLIFIFISIIATTLGTVKIPAKDVVKIILSKISFLNEKIDISNIKKSNIFIVINIRLPRIILASLVGAVLSIVGTCYQAIFRNPMADPYVMGASSGAAFGATFGIIFGLNNTILGFGLTSLFAFAGALLTTLIVFNLAKVGNKISTTSILLAGIVISSLLSSVISIMMVFNHRELAKIVTWTMGSFNGANWKQIIIVIIPIFFGVVVLSSMTKEMNAVVIGEESAKNLGVNVELIKKVILLLSSFLAACAVSVSGIIGFVGLIVPHLFRLIFGSDHRILIPISVVGGAIFLLICDTLARTVLNGIEIPVGIITSIFGGPFFLYLLRKSKRNKFI